MKRNIFLICLMLSCFSESLFSQTINLYGKTWSAASFTAFGNTDYRYGAYSFEEAKAKCASLGSGWRLPTEKEMDDLFAKGVTEYSKADESNYHVDYIRLEKHISSKVSDKAFYFQEMVGFWATDSRGSKMTYGFYKQYIDHGGNVPNQSIFKNRDSNDQGYCNCIKGSTPPPPAAPPSAPVSRSSGTSSKVPAPTQASYTPSSSQTNASNQTNPSGVNTINDQNASGDTGLHLAVRNANKTATDNLIAKGIDVNTRNFQGNTAIHEAVMNKNQAIAKSLINNSADVNFRNGKGKTPLLIAIDNDDKEMVKLLLDNYSDVNIADGNGKRALDHAIEKNDTELIEMIASKADFDKSDKTIKKAVLKRQNDLVEVLLQNGANPSRVLSMAEETNNLELFSTIIEGYNAKATNYMFENAVSNRRYEVASLILNSGIDTEKALDFAITKNEKTVIREILGLGGNPQKVMNYAITKRDVTLAGEAIDSGANPDRGMEEAVFSNQFPMVEMLLKKGANANLGIGPSVGKNNVKMTQLLLKNDADPNSQMNLAATNGFDQVIEVLLLYGADPNLGIRGAIQNGHVSTAKILLAADGADGNLALEYAVQKGNLSLVHASFNATITADPDRGMVAAIDYQRAEILEVLLENAADATKPSYMEKVCANANKTMVSSLLRWGASADPGMANAVKSNNEEIVALLLDPNLGDRKADGSQPQYLGTAAENGNLSIVKMLLNEGADPNAGMENAVNRNHPLIVSHLIDSGADGSQSSYIVTSSKNGYNEMVPVLLKAGGDPNAGMMPAIKGNFDHITGLLLEAGADGTKTGYISSAAVHNNPLLTGMLMQAGANPEEALSPAVNHDAYKVVRQLVEKGVDVTDVQHLTTAVHKDFLATSEELLKAGSDPNKGIDDTTGQGLLHHTADKGNLPMMKLLIAHDADVDSQVIGSLNTPLHILAPKGKKYMDHVKTLVDAGADVNMTNAQNYTVLKVAKSQKVKKIIKSAGGKRKLK